MKRIFIYSQCSLFSHAIKMLLDAEATVEVVGCERDLDKALTCIEAAQPDVILIVTEGKADESTPKGQRFFTVGHSAKVIELSLEENRVNVYYGEQIVIGDVRDLMRTIEAPITSHTPEHTLGQGPAQPSDGQEETAY